MSNVKCAVSERVKQPALDAYLSSGATTTTTRNQPTGNKDGDGVIQILIGQGIIESSEWKLEDNYCSIITTVAAVFQSKRRLVSI
jgi:hypothetical protein